MPRSRIRRSARRARAVPPLLVVALFATLLAGCRPPQGGGGSSATGGADAAGRTVEVDVVGAAELGPTELRVTVLHDGEPVEGAAVEITGDMTHAGMSPVIAGATGVDGRAGVYLSDGFEFTMAGDWILTVEVTYPDGAEVRAERLVSVASP